MARFSTTGGSGSGSALNYVQVAGEPIIISSAPNAFIDLDITTTGKPVQISVTGEGANASAGSWVKINLFRDNVAIGNEMQLEASAASENVPYAINFIDDVAAGTYNYSARVTTMSGGNWTFGEAGGPVMNAVELTGLKGDDGADGADGIANLVIPFTMKDENGDDLLGFEKGGTGVTRINALQDDLALRSARDIILYPGDDGPGNVYINWGDAEYTPDSTNRVATIADIQSAGTADFVFNTVESPDYESTMTVTNNDMVIKTVVDTEASGNIRVESAQGVTVDANGDILIESKNGSDIVKARITLDQSNEQVLIEALNPDDAFFDDTQWSTAVWSGTAVTIENTPDIINFFNTVPGNISNISINNGVPVAYQGASYGADNITIDVGGTPPEGEDPLTITSIRFYYPIISKIDINYDNGSFDIDAKNMPIDMSSTDEINITSGDDVTINAGGDDLRLRAFDDIAFIAGYANGDQYEWRMNNNGRFELPSSGYIENPNNASSDGNGLDTLHLVPDFEAIDAGTDQYIIIEPTSPNHIHVRSGGTIDNSNADLVLGGERTNVSISDNDRDVIITSRPALVTNSYTNLNDTNGTQFAVASTADIQVGYTVNVGGTDYTVDAVDAIEEGVVGVTAGGAQFEANTSYTFTFEPTSDYQWAFGSNGTLYGPVMGGVRVPSLVNTEPGTNLGLYSNDAGIDIQGNGDVAITSTDANVTITSSDDLRIESTFGNINMYMDGSAYIGDSINDNQIITRSDLNSLGTIPSGGTTGQVLSKVDGTDYNAEWVDASAGSATLTGIETLTNKTLTSPKINEDVAVTATATELNILDGATLSTTELNYVDGVTSAIQTQLDSKLSTATAGTTYAPKASPTFTGTVTLPATINGASSSTNMSLFPTTSAANVTIADAITNGTLALATGSAFSGTINIATGATTSGSKTINIGTGQSVTGATYMTLGSTNGASNINLLGVVYSNGLSAISNTAAVNLFNNTTIGNVTIGNALTSSSVALANGTNFSGSINIASGGTVSGTKTINIGANGQAGSTTSIVIGSGTGATSNTYLNGKVIMQNPTVPGSATATGTAGQIAWDANYIYVCTATNTWKRTAISTW